MYKRITGAAVAAALAVPMAAAADDAGLAELKRLIDQTRADYEARIQELEQRLERAEQAAARPVAAAAPQKSERGTVSSGNAFNPAISVILNGAYYADDVGGQADNLAGSVDGIHHAHAHDHGGHDHGGHAHGDLEEGFNLREAEVAISATVDPYFDAATYLAISSDGDVEVEEAWLQSRSLPAGLKVKAGKFFSGIGYVNAQHPHQWDFADQNLAYLNLLGDHGLNDTGVQLTWLPAWETYTLFGLELLQGEQEKLGALADGDAVAEAAAEAGVDEHDFGLSGEKAGPRLATAFVKVAPDLGYDHALQLGAWAARAEQQQEVHEDPAIHALDGDAWMWGLDAVYKYDAGRSYGHGDYQIQAEYLRQGKDLSVRYHETNPAVVGASRDFTEDGLYLQGWYGFAPRWRAGLRYDKVGLTNEVTGGGTTLDEWDASDRWTAALTWVPTEFSLLRLQYSRADLAIEGEREEVDSLYLQWVMSLGTHGAHTF